MTEATVPTTKAPWHLWVLGIVNLLWTAVGCFDFVMTNTHDDAYLMKMGLNAAQVAVYNSAPMWTTVGWGLGVFGGVIGSILLLMRRRIAVPVLAASAVGAVASQAHVFGAAGRAAYGATVWMSVAIIVWAVLIAWYGWSMGKRGVLR